jgi:hypothetical protein
MNSYSTIITIGPSLTGLRGTQPTGSINYTHVNYNNKFALRQYLLSEELMISPAITIYLYNRLVERDDDILILYFTKELSLN